MSLQPAGQGKNIPGPVFVYQYFWRFCEEIEEKDFQKLQKYVNITTDRLLVNSIDIFAWETKIERMFEKTIDNIRRMM